MPEQPKTLKPSPSPPKTQERILSQEVRYMLEQITKQYNNEVLKALNKGTVEKFEDKQAGNYASVVRTLSNRTKAKLLKRFGNKRIKAITKKVMDDVNRRNGEQLYQEVEDVIGVPTKQLLNQEALTPEFNALKIETEEWIKKLRDDHLIAINNNTLRMMTEGRTIEEVTKELNLNTAKSITKARMVARQQVSSFNGLSSKLRYQKNGVTEAIWVTSRDERVRPSHAQRDGKEFKLNEGLHSSIDGKTLYPGTDFNCRCTMKAILPEDDIE